jgi:GNAT superfamily N-acetyltransferase
MEIRLLRPNEVDAAADLMAANYAEHPEYREKARREIASMFVDHPVRPQFVVAVEGDTMVGFGGIAPSWFDYGVWEILWVNVTGVQQGKGVGTHLVEGLIAIARADNRQMIVLSCTAPAFYERFGFTVLSSLAGGYSLMGLKLQ